MRSTSLGGNTGQRSALLLQEWDTVQQQVVEWKKELDKAQLALDLALSSKKFVESLRHCEEWADDLAKASMETPRPSSRDRQRKGSPMQSLLCNRTGRQHRVRQIRFPVPAVVYCPFSHKDEGHKCHSAEGLQPVAKGTATAVTALRAVYRHIQRKTCVNMFTSDWFPEGKEVWLQIGKHGPCIQLQKTEVWVCVLLCVLCATPCRVIEQQRFFV